MKIVIPIAAEAIMDAHFRGSAIRNKPDHARYTYEISYNGENTRDNDRCWDIEAICELGGWRIKLPALSRENVDKLSMLIFCMGHASPGTADAWIRNLMCDEDAEYVIKNYYSVGDDGKLRA